MNLQKQVFLFLKEMRLKIERDKKAFGFGCLFQNICFALKLEGPLFKKAFSKKRDEIEKELEKNNEKLQQKTQKKSKTRKSFARKK